MIIVEPKRLTPFSKNNYNIPKLETKPVSRNLRKFFIWIQIIYSFDFGFITFKSSEFRIIAKVATSLYGLCLRVVCFLLYTTDMKRSYVFWYLKYIFENTVHVFILSLTPYDKSLCFFLEHLLSIDDRLGANCSFRFDFKLIICSILSVTYKILVTIVYCIEFIDCYLPSWTNYLYITPFLSLDLPLIVLYFTFYATKNRLVSLRKCIKDGEIGIKDFQYLYRSIIESTETIKKAFDPIYIVTLGVNVPSFMMIIYQIIKEIKLQLKPPLGYVTEIISLISVAFTIFAPAFSADSLATEMEKIKIILYNMMIDERDEKQLQDIKRFINYLEARPFKFCLLKIIPMDATLPIILINICITYVIVMLQITHLY